MKRQEQQLELGEELDEEEELEDDIIPPEFLETSTSCYRVTSST